MRKSSKKNNQANNQVTNQTSHQANQQTSYQNIFAIAIPVVLANIAIPIQGLIDTSIVGHFAHAYYLAGMGLAIQVISLLLVSFNFLQYATSGLSAQAVGKYSPVGCAEKQSLEVLGSENINLEKIGLDVLATELVAILHRAMVLAMLIGLVIFILRDWLIAFALSFFASTIDSYQVASDYLHIKMWGIIAELMNYAFLGWFAGQGKSKLMLYQQSFIAICNIMFTLSLVYWFDMGIKGVALGTVIAYWLGIAFACGLVTCPLNKSHLQISFLQLLTLKVSQFAKNKMIQLFSLNKDIFIRTLLLTLSLAWITKLSAMSGDVVLAVNAILLQVLSLSAYALDGLAVSAETLSGQSAGKKDWQAFTLIIKRTGLASFALAGVLSLLWWLGFPSYLVVMSSLSEVIALAYDYRWFAILLPIVGVGAYWLDGVFFGLTAGRSIRNIAIGVAVIFFPLSYYLYLEYAMLGIWLSVWALLLLRFLLLAVTLSFQVFKKMI